MATTRPGTTYRCKVDNLSYATCTSPFTTAVLADGEHSFSVYAVDPAGNDDSGSPAEFTWSIDTAKPMTTITGDSGVLNTSTVNFGFTANESASFVCSLTPGPGFSTCSVSQSYPIPGADGNYTFSVQASDAAGNNELAPKTRTVTIDRTAPVASFVSRPVSNSDEDVATFDFAMTDANPQTNTAQGFQCSLDAAGFTNCGDPITFTGLGEGSHTLEVRAKDAATPANVGPPISYTWNVDTVSPNTTINTSFPVSNRTTDTTPAFDFESNEAGVTFQCRVGATASFETCVPGQSFGPFADVSGPHTLFVRARDASGNIDLTAAEYSFFVDASAPAVGITVPAQNFATNDTEPVFSGSGGAAANDATNVTVRIFTGTPTCAANTICPGTALHTIARPVTGAGNWSGAMPTLAEGIYTVQVSQTDGLNTTNSAGRVFKIDTTPPTITALTRCGSRTPAPANACVAMDPQSKVVNTTVYDFAFNASEGTTQFPTSFQCRLNSNNFSACNQAGPAEEQSNVFFVRAIDAAGNVGVAAESVAWVVDLTGPTLQGNPVITFNVPAGPTNRSQATVSQFSNPDGTIIECGLDGTFTQCQAEGSRTFTNLTEGSHTIAVRGRDTLGNIGPAVSRTFLVDRSAPALAITGGPDGLVNSAIATYTFSATDATAVTYTCSLDNVQPVSCTSGKQYTNLTEGQHTFSVVARDSVTDATVNLTSTQTRTFRVDTTTPETTILEGPAGTTTATAATFVFATNEPGSKLECRIDDQEFRECPERTQFTDLPAGTHTVQVRARDQAGNVDTTPSSRTWTVEGGAVTPPPPPEPTEAEKKAKRLAEQKARAKTALGEESDIISFPLLIDPAAVFHGTSSKDGIVDVKAASTKLMVFFCDGCSVKVVPTLALDNVSKSVKLAKNLRVALPGQSAKLAAGQPMTVRLRLTSKERAAIPKAKKAQVTLKLTMTDAAGKTTTVTKTYTLKVPKAKKAKRTKRGSRSVVPPLSVIGQGRTLCTSGSPPLAGPGVESRAISCAPRALRPAARSSRQCASSSALGPLRFSPGVSSTQGRPSKRGSENHVRAARPRRARPRRRWRGGRGWSPVGSAESLRCSEPNRSRPTSSTHSSRTLVSLAGVRMSKPDASRWQESRQRPRRSSPPAASTSAASSWNDRPSVPPAPAVFSRCSGQVLALGQRLLDDVAGPGDRQVDVAGLRAARVQHHGVGAEGRALRAATPSARSASSRGCPGRRRRR